LHLIRTTVRCWIAWTRIWPSLWTARPDWARCVPWAFLLSWAASKTLVASLCFLLEQHPRHSVSCVFISSSIQDIAFVVCSRWSQELLT
jgi:hypothetical protein